MLLSSVSGTAEVQASATRQPKPAIRAEEAALPAAEAGALAKAQHSERPAPTEVEKALKTLNEFTSVVAQDVRFTMDEESGKTIVKVVDTATQEVLRQFPSAEALSIARAIDKMQGLLIREKA
jgi:flagellar protein FlaG